MNHSISIYPGHYVIENDAPAPFYFFLNESGGGRFYYIEKPEKKKSQENGQPCWRK